MSIDELINALNKFRYIKEVPGDTQVLIDAPGGLYRIAECDMDGSDAGVVLWTGEAEA